MQRFSCVYMTTCLCGSRRGPVSLHLQNLWRGNHPQPGTPTGGQAAEPSPDTQVSLCNCLVSTAVMDEPSPDTQVSLCNCLVTKAARDEPSPDTQVSLCNCLVTTAARDEPLRTGWGNRLCSWKTWWGNRQHSWQFRVGQQAALPLHLQNVLGLVDEPSKLGLS